MFRVVLFFSTAEFTVSFIGKTIDVRINRSFVERCVVGNAPRCVNLEGEREREREREQEREEGGTWKKEEGKWGKLNNGIWHCWHCSSLTTI